MARKALQRPKERCPKPYLPLQTRMFPAGIKKFCTRSSKNAPMREALATSFVLSDNISLTRCKCPRFDGKTIKHLILCQDYNCGRKLLLRRLPMVHTMLQLSQQELLLTFPASLKIRCRCFHSAWQPHQDSPLLFSFCNSAMIEKGKGFRCTCKVTFPIGSLLPWMISSF